MLIMLTLLLEQSFDAVGSISIWWVRILGFLPGGTTVLYDKVDVLLTATRDNVKILLIQRLEAENQQNVVKSKQLHIKGLIIAGPTEKGKRISCLKSTAVKN